MKTKINNFTNNRNETSLLNIFVNKQIYEDNIMPLVYYPYYYDSKKQTLYGLLNLNADIVFPLTPNNNDIYRFYNNVPMFDFIYNAFTEMRSYISKNVFTNKFNLNSNLLYIDLEPKKCYADVNNEYIEHLQKYFNAFNNFLIQERIKEVSNFDKFINYFLKFVELSLKNYPLTRSSFIVSNFCTNNISGLNVEILNKADYNSDIDKYNLFFTNPNFDAVYDAAKRYGFMIDKYAPWRFVFDINSSAGINYMKQVGINKIEELFKFRYYRSINTEIEILKTSLLEIYNTLVQKDPVSENIYFNKYCNKFQSEKTQKQFITQEVITERYNDNFWIRLYTYIRAIETSKKYNQEQFELIVRKAQQINSYSGLDKSMDYLSSIFVITEPPQNNLGLTDQLGGGIISSNNDELFVQRGFKF